MMNYDLQKLHTTLLEILDFFVSVCNDNNLTYFLAYGTALGAYRHHGFIPWDDDLDVAMPREDYQQFLDIMSANPDKRYSVQNENTEHNWFLTFSKLRKNGTVFIESIAQNIYHNNGIYIDIFPLDYITAKGKIVDKCKMLEINYIRHELKFLSCKELYRHKYKTTRFFLEYILTFPIAIIGKDSALKKLNHMRMSQCAREEATYIAEYDDPHAVRIRKDIYFPERKLEFEGKEYKVPNKIKEYLSIIYGKTYMELPPVEERRTHEPIQIKF